MKGFFLTKIANFHYSISSIVLLEIYFKIHYILVSLLIEIIAFGKLKLGKYVIICSLMITKHIPYWYNLSRFFYMIFILNIIAYLPEETEYSSGKTLRIFTCNVRCTIGLGN